MMDFFVRESRAIVDGPMAMIRYGTCGGLSEIAVPGKVAVASGGSGYVVRNPDAFTHLYEAGAEKKSSNPYFFFNVCPADATLSGLVTKSLTDSLGADSFVEGVNVTADSFYSSQGRLDDRFQDDNHTMVQDIVKHYPDAASMEMETFMLFNLAKSCHIPIRATAAAIVLANRLIGTVVEGDVLKNIEELGGKAVLHAVATVEL
jgi:uridine phosphorylase